DHTALLGGTIEEIAREKAGIIRSGTPLILGRQPIAAGENTVLAEAEALGTPVFRPEAAPEGWLPENTPAFLQENFATAWKTLEVLGVRPERSVFRSPLLRARFEMLRREPPVIIDAAHNGDSAGRLTEALNQAFPGIRFTCVLGAVPGKDVAGIVQGLSGMNADFILTDPHTQRGSALKELEEAARACGLNIRAVMPRIESESDLPAGTPLLFTGSFFTALIGEKIFQVRK
ncbi:MAG: hypothetical protein J6S21_07155, partial [Victivallales bacterium]|nr:hypothetical protein [Victivallales bacterium]